MGFMCNTMFLNTCVGDLVGHYGFEYEIQALEYALLTVFHLSKV